MEVEITLYDKREKTTTLIIAEQVAENKFRMIENDLVNCRLTRGTEFETRINKDGLHEIIRIVKESEFITRRFLLNRNYSKADYEMLGEELVKLGGFWQVDFGGFLTVNIPKDFEVDIDASIRDFGIKMAEVI